jgi:hypothetical protein
MQCNVTDHKKKLAAIERKLYTYHFDCSVATVIAMLFTKPPLYVVWFDSCNTSMYGLYQL